MFHNLLYKYRIGEYNNKLYNNISNNVLLNTDTNRIYIIVNNILSLANKMFICTLKLVYIGNSYYIIL